MLGHVEIKERDVNAYLEEFAKVKDLAGRGAIAQLVMPHLASTFLGYRALERENMNLNVMVAASKRETADLGPALDALWYLVHRDTVTGSCPPVPPDLKVGPYADLVDAIRERISTMYGELGEHLESRLNLAVNTLSNGVLSMIHMDEGRAMVGDVQVSPKGMHSSESRRINNHVFLTVEKAMDRQKAECVSAIMEGRTPRLLNKQGEFDGGDE